MGVTGGRVPGSRGLCGAVTSCLFRGLSPLVESEAPRQGLGQAGEGDSVPPSSLPPGNFGAAWEGRCSWSRGQTGRVLRAALAL